MDKQITFTDINKAELLEVENHSPQKGQIRVKTAVSTISNGTEKANITGDPAVSIYASDSVVFPRILGYSSAGVIVEKGEDVEGFEIGDRVAMFGSSHRGYNTISAKNAVKIPDGVTFSEAAISYIGAFPLAAIRKTRLEIGESAMVMGLGTLGLLAIGFLHAAGAVPVIAVDPVSDRRKKALDFGADYAFDPFDADFAEKVKAVTNGGVNVAIEVTGQGAGLNEALDCMAKFGRVSLLGCTRNSDFTVDYYRKIHGPGITLIGAHTMARPEFESHPGFFTAADDIKTMLNLCKMGRLDLKSLVEEIHSPTECAEVYTRLVNERNFPTVVQFDWSEVHGK